MPFPFISVTAVFAAQQHTSKMFNASLSFEILSMGRNGPVMNVLVSFHYWRRSFGKPLKHFQFF